MFLSSHYLTLFCSLSSQRKKQKRKKKIVSPPELFVREMNALGHEMRGGEEGWLYLDTSDLQGLSCTEQHPALNASSLWQQELP